MDAARTALSAGGRDGGCFGGALVVAAHGSELSAGSSAHGAGRCDRFGGGDALAESGIAGVSGFVACAGAGGCASGALASDGCAGVGEATVEGTDTTARDGGVEVRSRGTGGALDDALSAFDLAIGLGGGAGAFGAIGICASRASEASRFGATVGDGGP